MDQQANSPLKLNSGLIGEVIRFAVVGVINTAVDFIILNILIKLTGISEGNGLIPLNVISFTCAVVNSYYLNKRWSFKDNSSSEGGKKFSVFILVSLVGIVINTAVLRIISTNISPMFGLSQVLWTNVAKVAATGISLVWNFIGYKLFVFKK